LSPCTSQAIIRHRGIDTFWWRSDIIFHGYWIVTELSTGWN
jgi:hypothetical protein